MLKIGCGKLSRFNYACEFEVKNVFRTVSIQHQIYVASFAYFTLAIYYDCMNTCMIFMMGESHDGAKVVPQLIRKKNETYCLLYR